jgi:hypothetical protein
VRKASLVSSLIFRLHRLELAGFLFKKSTRSFLLFAPAKCPCSVVCGVSNLIKHLIIIWCGFLGKNPTRLILLCSRADCELVWENSSFVGR